MLAIVDWEYTRAVINRILADKKSFEVICENTEQWSKCQRNVDEMRKELSESNWLRVVILAVSLFGVITLYMRHLIKSRWLNEDLPAEMMKNNYILGGDANTTELLDGNWKRRNWFQISFWLEAAIFLVCPVPFKDWSVVVKTIDTTDKSQYIRIYYLVSDFILVFMFLRVFFIIRAIFNYNMYMDSFAKKLCRSYGFTANIRFTFKSLLKTDPAKTVSTLFFASVFILAYQLRVFEI